MFEQAMLLKPYWPAHAPPRVAMPPIKLSLPKPLVVLALSLDALPGLLQAPSMSCFANTKSLRVDNCFVLLLFLILTPVRSPMRIPFCTLE